MRWLKAYLLRNRRYDDLAVSIEEHLQDRVDELMENGMPREDAEKVPIGSLET